MREHVHKYHPGSVQLTVAAPTRMQSWLKCSQGVARRLRVARRGLIDWSRCMCKHHHLQADLVTHIHLQHHAGGVAVDSITAHQVHKAIQAPVRCLIRAVSCGLFRPRKLKLPRIAKTYRPP